MIPKTRSLYCEFSGPVVLIDGCYDFEYHST